jgi:murein DD-endopeptidase MepM/ murein hydrolase activator NlpD
VVIDHPFGYRSLFGHLSTIQVKAGDTIARGQVIALSGNTGRSTGPHLHYTLFYGDKTLDPATYLLAQR